MSNWFHRFFNPHCPDCIREREASRICQSCETLTMQLALANSEKEQLLKRLLEKPEPIPETKPVEVTMPKHIPWNTRRQMLEQEDRERARALRNAPKPISTEDLEKELNVVESDRMNESVMSEANARPNT